MEARSTTHFPFAVRQDIGWRMTNGTASPGESPRGETEGALDGGTATGASDLLTNQASGGVDTSRAARTVSTHLGTPALRPPQAARRIAAFRTDAVAKGSAAATSEMTPGWWIGSQNILDEVKLGWPSPLLVVLTIASGTFHRLFRNRLGGTVIDVMRARDSHGASSAGAEAVTRPDSTRPASRSNRVEGRPASSAPQIRMDSRVLPLFVTSNVAAYALRPTRSVSCTLVMSESGRRFTTTTT